MEVFKFLTPGIYLLLVFTWTYILFFYWKQMTYGKIEDKLLKTLLLILSIDAFRTLFESSYFGLWYTSLSELIPISIYNFLAQPQIVFFPKILNLTASFLILFILVRKWIPAEKSRLEQINSLVKKQTSELEQNIKDLNLVKEDLKLSEEKYKSTFEYFPYPISIWEYQNKDFHLVNLNKAAYLELVKLGREPIKKSAADYWKERPESFQLLLDCYETKKTKTIEKTIATKNGDFILSITLSYLPPNRIQIQTLDITAQRKAQLALHEQKLLFEAMFNTIPDGIVITNTKREIQLVNRGMYTTFGYSENELVGKTTSFLYADIENFEAAGKNVFNKEVSNPEKNYVVNYQNKNKQTFPGETYGTKLFDKNGEWIGNIGIMRNISERVNFIEQIEQAREKAEESDRLKSAFLANMSHEIRTPLNSIMGFSSLLGDGELVDQERQKFIKIINENGQQLLAIISDVLDLSKIESDQLELHFSNFTINEELDDLYELFAQKLQTSGKSIQLLKNYSLLLKDSSLVTDKVRFKQIFSNLLSNALKHTTEGEITIGYKPMESSIRFYVKDTGEGISKQDQSKLFKRFSQVNPRGTGNIISGSGLGLAISKKLTELLDGSIGFHSEENVGSTFYFDLPTRNKI